jgi:hypothetical protein
MNIIIGEVAAEKLKENYTVLELETFKLKNSNVKTYCVVENIPFDELPELENLKKLHQSFIDAYNSGEYQFCDDAIEYLRGKFDGELDTFYNVILDKINSKNTTLS